MKILPFAFRNLSRNRTRTVVTIGAMAFAGAVMIFYSSLMEGFAKTFERNMVSMNLGEIQIHAVGYRDDPDLYTTIDNGMQIINELKKKNFSAAPRLFGFGLAASGLTSSGVQLRGVDVARESMVTMAHKHMLEGKWLDSADDRGVVLGRKLARTLNANVGSEIVIVSQASDGSMANDIYLARGILKSVGEGIDRSGFFMSESAFRKLFVMPEGIHEIAVARGANGGDIKSATLIVSKIAEGHETKSWRELQPVIARILDNVEAGTIIMLLIVYAAIGMVTLNAMLMSVFERIREFGIMKAVGVSPWQIIALIAAEAMFQALIASALALTAGFTISYYFQSHGIDLSAWSGSSVASVGGVAMDPVWYTNITFDSVVKPIVFLILIVGIAVIYPGIKAAVIQPVKAIHHQ